ncbi:LysR substrate-binding domain-containing protein [Helcobacillus massiliensis]|uniref:LysR substrate-binding domain-containing protein n=1 Tax=Helcobacillus massiliensis TaxID=521392 RepID=UPI0021A676C9|nr:LysR substrate-binding domain-containing protein [Helcobacillus massiliensis]MCT1558685.1 LysR substrate-binding domain-containing protein [Helcobacillus massiliensis]MCT2037279.1 LysR substrate-binding domain-containing protein [Helcobacillus massiliensis]MCT2332907.1 LysR substrate-binding domain-containing protein [Helcobacillus massiliensis]
MSSRAKRGPARGGRPAAGRSRTGGRGKKPSAQEQRRTGRKRTSGDRHEAADRQAAKDERTLRVGFIPGVEPDRFGRRWRQSPLRADLELVPLVERDPLQALAAGEVDMVFARFDPAQVVGGSHLDPPIDLHAVPLWQEVPVAVMSRDNELSILDEVSDADLEDEHVFDQQRPGDEKERVLIVGAGIGCTIMPMSLARFHHRRTVVHRPYVDGEPTQIALCWPTDADDDLRQEFVAVVRGRTSRSSR